LTPNILINKSAEKEGKKEKNMEVNMFKSLKSKGILPQETGISILRLGKC